MSDDAEPLKLFVVVEIIEGLESAPLISIHTTKEGAHRRMLELEEENDNIGMRKDEIITVCNEVEVLP